MWGTPLEKGVAQGELLGAELNDFMQAVWSYLESQVVGAINGALKLPKWLEELAATEGLEGALDLTAWATSAYTGKYYYEELEGMCRGAGHGVGRDTACYKLALRVHMLASLTQGHWCVLLVVSISLPTPRSIYSSSCSFLPCPT